MDFWNLMVKKDDLIIDLINKVWAFKSKFNFKERKLIQKMKHKRPLGIDRSSYIILNGPSIKKQDLSILKGKSIMFVNKGFKHELFKSLNPEFYVMVDSKLMTGEWPITWLDEILEMAPNITFVMPVSWAFEDKIKPYIEKGVNFHWLETLEPLKCLGVSGSCFNFAISQGFKDIYFTGFDANGLGYELIKENSHFFGVNEDNLKKTSKNYIIDLYMHSRHLHELHRFKWVCDKKKISIVNLTEGGLLDMFPRLDFDKIKRD
jgi:hypothetical protein